MRSLKTDLRVIGVAVFVVALSLGTGCTTTKTADDTMGDWESVLAGTIDSPYTMHFSPDSTFVLAASSTRPTRRVPNPALHFVVVERETALVLQNTKPGPARVEWFDALRVKVLLTPGMVPEDGGVSGYLLQVRTGERSSLE